MSINLAFAETIYCPAKLVCTINQNNNFTCNPADKSNFKDWHVMIDVPAKAGDYSFVEAGVYNQGRKPTCWYLRYTRDDMYGPLVIESTHKYYPTGPNWAKNFDPTWTCGEDGHNLVFPQRCPFSTSQSNEYLHPSL